MEAINDSVTTNATTTSKSKVQLNYNCAPLNTGEVLVPMIVDELFIQENVTNPDSIVYLRINGKYFKAVLIAVPEEFASVAKSDNYLVINEALGHYSKGNISLDEIEDEFELGLGALPSFEDTLFESDVMEMFKDILMQLLDKSPKHALAVLLRITGTQGKRFESIMKLKHEAANTLRKDVDDIIAAGLKDFDISAFKANKSKNSQYYLETAYEILDNLMELI